MATLKQPVSEYVRIRKYVFQLALKGGSENRQLPSLTELCQQFNVSRPTVVKALRQLIEEGVLISRQGIGTFTNPRFCTSPYGNRKYPVIGLLLGDGMYAYLDCYFGSAVSAVMAELFKIPALLHMINFSSSRPDVILRDIRNEDLDALICIATPDNLIELLKDSGLKIVCALCDNTGPFPNIRPDYHAIGYEAARLCFAEKRTDIVYLPDIGNSGRWDCALDGIRRACLENGTPFDENRKFSGTDYLSDFRKFLKTEEIPQAIFINSMYSESIRTLLAEFHIDTREQCRIIQQGGYGDGSIVYNYDFAALARQVHSTLQEISDNRNPGNTIVKWDVYKEKITL